MFKLYAEKQPAPSIKGKSSEMDKTVGFWLPDDAEQVPLAEGDNFRRELKNGNYLQPMHWLFVHLHEFPELKDALIPFQSKGNADYTKIVKLVKANSSLATELVIDLKCVGELNVEFNKTYYYVRDIEVVGKNFDFDAETGKVSLIKGGMPGDEVKELLLLSGKMMQEYAQAKLVSRKSPQQLLTYVGGAGAPIPHKGLPGSSSGGYAEDEGETPNF